jgi:hypothetical protein
MWMDLIEVVPITCSRTLHSNIERMPGWGGGGYKAYQQLWKLIWPLCQKWRFHVTLTGTHSSQSKLLLTYIVMFAWDASPVTPTAWDLSPVTHALIASPVTPTPETCLQSHVHPLYETRIQSHVHPLHETRIQSHVHPLHETNLQSHVHPLHETCLQSLIHPLHETHLQSLIHPVHETHLQSFIHPLHETHLQSLIHPLHETHLQSLVHPLHETLNFFVLCVCWMKVLNIYGDWRNQKTARIKEKYEVSLRSRLFSASEEVQLLKVQIKEVCEFNISLRLCMCWA